MNNSISDPEPVRKRPGPVQTSHKLEWHEGDMPYSTDFGDHFYCRTDGRLECGHVFLRRQRPAGSLDRRDIIPYRRTRLRHRTEPLRDLAQWKETRGPDGRLHFTSFELYPMAGDELDRALTRFPQINAERQALVALWPQVTDGRDRPDLDAQTRLTVVCGPASTGIGSREELFDAWFLDGFAPARNPDMWSLDLMQVLQARTVPAGTFATYAAAGFVRRNLTAAGFRVERRQGFAGKREMLCGIKG